MFYGSRDIIKLRSPKCVGLKTDLQSCATRCKSMSSFTRSLPHLIKLLANDTTSSHCFMFSLFGYRNIACT